MVAWEDKCCKPQTFLLFLLFTELLLLSTSCGLGHPFGQFGSDIPNTSLQSYFPPACSLGRGGKEKVLKWFYIEALSALCSHKSKAEHHSTAENPAPTQTEPMCWCWPLLFAEMETIVHCRVLLTMKAFMAAAVRLGRCHEREGLACQSKGEIRIVLISRPYTFSVPYLLIRFMCHRAN